MVEISWGSITPVFWENLDGTSFFWKFPRLEPKPGGSFGLGNWICNCSDFSLLVGFFLMRISHLLKIFISHFCIRNFAGRLIGSLLIQDLSKYSVTDAGTSSPTQNLDWNYVLVADLEIWSEVCCVVGMLMVESEVDLISCKHTGS